MISINTLITNSINITTGPVDDGKTRVKYTASSGLPNWEGDIVGELTSNSIPNISDIAEVVIGSHVTSIGYPAFGSCSGLTSVTIGDGVTSIGVYAFENCSGLTRVTIPDSVTSIENRAFYGCNNSLYDTTTIPGLSIIDGWIVDNNKQISGALNISGIRGIAQIALAYSNDLTSVSISGSAVSITKYAFCFCPNLASVTIDDSVVNIGEYAFYYCEGLTNAIFEGRTIAQIQQMANFDFWFFKAGTVTVTGTDGSITVTQSCILKGTDILLADNTTKKIEDLTYDDVLKVWDFDEGQLGSAKVCWLTRPGLKSDHYYQLTFDNGTILKTTGINSNHRIFSVDQSKFTNVADANVGDKVFSIDGTLTITDVKYVEEECEYYNVMTSGKINCFANGILTSDRYGNLYPIVDMKYVKDDRTVRPYSEYETVGIDRYWYDNLRLGENTETVEKSKEYVWKCLGQMLPLPETKN